MDGTRLAVCKPLARFGDLVQRALFSGHKWVDSLPGLQLHHVPQRDDLLPGRTCDDFMLDHSGVLARWHAHMQHFHWLPTI